MILCMISHLQLGDLEHGAALHSHSRFPGVYFLVGSFSGSVLSIAAHLREVAAEAGESVEEEEDDEAAEG